MLDDKGRITIPSAWRSAHAEEETFLATPHPDGYIAVLPPSEVEKLHAKFSDLKLGDAAAQAFAARFFSQTQGFSFDKAGRIGLGAPLLVHAGIEKDAVLVGSLTKFNIYSPARWQQEEARTAGENFGDLMRRLDI
jgi:MraZ protein